MTVDHSSRPRPRRTAACASPEPLRRPPLPAPPPARSPAWCCCCSACCSPAGSTPPSPRPRPRPQPATPSWSRRAASSSWSAAPTATARTARATSPINGKNLGPPLAGVGAAAVDFQVGTGRMPLAQPGAQGPTKHRVVYNDDEIAAHRRLRRQPGPRPGGPRRGRLQPRRPLGGAAPGGHPARRPDLPDQLHGVPQLRRQGRRDAARRLRAQPRAAPTPEHIYEAMLTGPGNMADLLQRQPVAGGEA